MATYTAAAMAETRFLSPWYPSRDWLIFHSLSMSEASDLISARHSALGVTKEATRSGYSNPGQNSNGRTSVSQNSDTGVSSSVDASSMMRQGVVSAAEMRSEGSRDTFRWSLRSILVPAAIPSALNGGAVTNGGSDLSVNSTFLTSSSASAVAVSTGFIPFL